MSLPNAGPPSCVILLCPRSNRIRMACYPKVRLRRGAMKCPSCQRENSIQAKFCQGCAAPLAPTCANCGNRLSSSAKFCAECGHPRNPHTFDPRFSSPQGYTPPHISDKTLTSTTAPEGERKQITVLFADIKGSMELLSADCQRARAYEPRPECRAGGTIGASRAPG
jgi:predicted amidophosphoribosyltransferase